MCGHKQVTQYIFGVKEGESKNKQVPKYFTDTPSDFKIAEVPVQEDTTISDTTPISKLIIYGEHTITSDCKKVSPSIEGKSPFHEPNKSKGSVVEEVQFVMSQINLSTKNESGTKKRKTEVPTYDFQTPPNLSPQRSKLLFEISIHSSNSKKKSGLSGKGGTHTSGEKRRNTKTTGLSTPRSTISSRRNKAKQSADNSPSGEYDAWKYAGLRPGTSFSPTLQFTSDGDGSLSSPERKGNPAAKTSFMSKKRAENSEERRLIKKRGLAIRYGKNIHLRKSSPDSKKKEPTASIIPCTSKKATIIEDTTGTRYPEPTELRDDPPVHKNYTITHNFKHIFIDVVEQGQYSMCMYFMKFLYPSDLLIILTSNIGIFSSKVSYQLVIDLDRRTFPRRAYTVIERMLTEVENETLRPSSVHILRLMAQQGCELCQKRNHGLLNYASLNFGCAYCSDFLRENLEEVPIAEIYRRSSKVVQFQTLSNTGFKPHFYGMKSYKVTYRLKKKVGKKYGGPIQESSLCSTRLESGSLTSAEWILLGRDNYKRRGRMTYFTDTSSTPEFKAYSGDKGTTWRYMLKRKAKIVFNLYQT
jgi:hypothetical protein